MDKPRVEIVLKVLYRIWIKWLATAEFVVNNKVHVAIKILPLIANYRSELRMRMDIRRKEKVGKVIEFAERIRKL